jgi:ABC-type phosphate/phosphonate transport system substrate-binding protein
MKKPCIASLILAAVVAIASAGAVGAEDASEFRLAVTQDARGAAARYRPLINYLRRFGIEISITAARSYRDAADLFAAGRVDGMFSGSGVAGTLIIKGLAEPAVRPEHPDGWSTYWAVVLAPKGSARFTQNADYFADKRVIFSGLASSGEFFYEAIRAGQELDATTLHASSHGAAVDALARGQADVAIVKNRVWDGLEDRFGDIIRVGEDPGENPNGTLIIAKTADPAVVEQLIAALLALEADDSPEAKAVKESLGISRYLPTSIDDFRFTLDLLRRAGVDERFEFRFD